MPSVLLITERFYPEDATINELVRYWESESIAVTVFTQTPSYPKGEVFKVTGTVYFPQRCREKQRSLGFIRFLATKKSVVLKIIGYLFFALMGSLITPFLARNVDSVFVFQSGPLTQAFPLVLLKRLYPRKNMLIWTLEVWPDSVFAYGFRQHPFSKVCSESVCWLNLSVLLSHYLSVAVGFAKELRDMSKSR